MVTAELQLILSNLRVWFIRMLGGSVYLVSNMLRKGAGTKLLMTTVCPSEGLDAGDARLRRFAPEFVGLIPAYAPD